MTEPETPVYSLDRSAVLHGCEVAAGACIRILRGGTEDGEIMAMQHKEYPLIGIQFHPESIYTDHGKKMIENFLEL